MDIRIILVLLGHSNLLTTARYTHVATTTIAATQSPFHHKGVAAGLTPMRDSEKLSCRIVSKDFSVNENSEDQGPDPIDVAVGHRIRVRRKWLGISQSTLADHLGVSFQQVQKYERGANRVSASMLVKIAQKLDTSVGELVGETAAPLGDESLFEKLAVPGAVQLLEAFASVQQPAMRTAILNLTRSLIEESSDERTLGIRRAR